MKAFKQNMKEEVEMIKRRFYYMHLYFKDMLQLAISMIEQNSGEKLRSKAKHVWILIRLL